MSELLRELRLAGRQLARRPWINALAVLSLALGIGVNSSIFSIVNAVLFKQNVAKEPDRVLAVYCGDERFRYATFSFPDYLDLRDKTTAFSDVAAYNVSAGSWEGDEHQELLFGQEATGNYFRLMGLPMVLGRDFAAEDALPAGTQPVVVLGERFWRKRFGADPAVLGSTFKLNGKSLTIIGVAPAKAKGAIPGLVADYWVPMLMHDALETHGNLKERGSRSLFVLGRLAAGMSRDQAEAQVATLAKQLAVAYPESNENHAFTTVPVSQVALNPGIDGYLFGVAGFLMAIVGLVLLIACSNIANLLLARSSDRGREIAVRLAVGSSRWQLVRQLLAESFLLAGAGGALGLLFAIWTASFLVSFKPPLPIPLALDVSLDGRVLGFTLLLALVTGLLCGLAPALQSSRPQLVTALKSDASAGRVHRRFGLRNLLVVSQVALSTVLLLCAGLFLRSLGQAKSIDPGFSLRNGVVAQVPLGLGGAYDEARGRRFYREVSERLSALPGVEAVALAESLPLAGEIRTDDVEIEGQPLPEDQKDGIEVDTTEVGPAYFHTMGIAVTAGRDFSWTDGPETSAVVAVNQAAAERFWPGESALGKRVRFGKDKPWETVVAVVANGKYRTLGEDPRPYVYRSMLQQYSEMATVVVVSQRNERELLNVVERELKAMDPNLALFGIKTMSDHLAFMLFPARMAATLLAGLGLLGLLLASVGLYGVVAYSVAKRTREVGIRMAIGADAGKVVRLVVREGMSLVGVGMAVGIGLALLASQALKSYLYGIASTDLVTFTLVPLLLAAVALVANLIPAKRATQIAPVAALRAE